MGRQTAKEAVADCGEDYYQMMRDGDQIGEYLHNEGFNQCDVCNKWDGQDQFATSGGIEGEPTVCEHCIRKKSLGESNNYLHCWSFWNTCACGKDILTKQKLKVIKNNPAFTESLCNASKINDKPICGDCALEETLKIMRHTQGGLTEKEINLIINDWFKTLVEIRNKENRLV